MTQGPSVTPGTTQPSGSLPGEWWADALLRLPPSEIERIGKLLADFHGAISRGDKEQIAKRRRVLRRAMITSYGTYLKDAPVEEIDAILGNLQSDNLSAVIKKDRKEPKKKVPPKFEYPEPDKEAELDAIQQRSSELAHVARTVAGLGLAGADVRMLVTGLHELSGRCEELARQIGMHAVSQRKMTQRELSRDLGVHELTVHRWVKAAQEQQDSQEPQNL